MGAGSDGDLGEERVGARRGQIVTWTGGSNVDWIGAGSDRDWRRSEY